MDQPKYIYDIDDRPPLRFALVYAIQWTIIIFPVFLASAVLPTKVLHFGPAEEVRFLQLILPTSGLFTSIQCLWGHKYPVVDGPSTALLLTFLVMAPFGLPAIQAGAILGGALLAASVLLLKPERMTSIMTPNITGVILMLIAFSLLPYLNRLMTGAESSASGASATKFLFSILLIMLMATLAYRLRGFLKTIWLLLGMLIGTGCFYLLERPSLENFFSAGWLSSPHDMIPSRPEFTWSAAIGFAVSYLAVVVNSIGSIQAIANITSTVRLRQAIHRGLFLNGLGGVICGLMGTIGMVSYSMSPGIVLSNQVASRFCVALSGVFFILAAFVPKFAAFFALVPGPVVGAALCTAMGFQIGAALALVTQKGIDQRSYYIVGLPVITGTLIGFLPGEILNSVPQIFRVFLGNGLTFGILFVMLLEHVILRKRKSEVIA